jgi:hypothetical protein
LDQVGRRQRLRNFGLIFRFEVIENAGGVSAFGIAEAFNCLVLKFREDLVAELAVRLGQRGAIELGSHHLDEPGAQLRFEQGSEQAEVGLVCVPIPAMPRRSGLQSRACAIFRLSLRIKGQ